MTFIYHYPGEGDKTTYDLENMIADPEGRIERFMESMAPFEGATLVDVGAGGGYHACLYAQRAAHVFAVEPAPKMLGQLYNRVAEGTPGNTGNMSVIAADAENIPLRDSLADIVHSRFAYFFGPGGGGVRSCEPGIVEVMRILKPGGYFFIVDNALTTGKFAEYLSMYAYSKGRAAQMQEANDNFYAGHGFSHVTIESTWTAPDRETLSRVIAMEFPPEAHEPIMSDVAGAELTYHYRVYYRQK